MRGESRKNKGISSFFVPQSPPNYHDHAWLRSSDVKTLFRLRELFEACYFGSPLLGCFAGWLLAGLEAGGPLGGGVRRPGREGKRIGEFWVVGRRRHCSIVLVRRIGLCSAE